MSGFFTLLDTEKFFSAHVVRYLPDNKRLIQFGCEYCFDFGLVVLFYKKIRSCFLIMFVAPRLAKVSRGSSIFFRRGT